MPSQGLEGLLTILTTDRAILSDHLNGRMGDQFQRALFEQVTTQIQGESNDHRGDHIGRETPVEGIRPDFSQDSSNDETDDPEEQKYDEDNRGPRKVRLLPKVLIGGGKSHASASGPLGSV